MSSEETARRQEIRNRISCVARDLGHTESVPQSRRQSHVPSRTSRVTSHLLNGKRSSKQISASSEDDEEYTPQNFSRRTKRARVDPVVVVSRAEREIELRSLFATSPKTLPKTPRTPKRTSLRRPNATEPYKVRPGYTIFITPKE